MSMKIFVAILVSAMLCMQPALAVQAVGNGSVSLPVGPTSGGTGLSAAAAGCLVYASSSNVFSCLAIGNPGDALNVTGGLPAWAAGGGGGPTLGATQTWTGVNTFSGTSFSMFKFNCTDSTNCTQTVTTNNGSGGQKINIGPRNISCNNSIGANGVMYSIASQFNAYGMTNGAYILAGAGYNGNPGISTCFPLYNVGGIYSDATSSTDGVTLAYPWYPGTQPACNVAVAGTSCTTSNITLPHANMQCTANPVGSGLIGGIGQFAPGITYPTTTTFNITANFVSSVAGGGTDTFSVVCN